MAVGGRPEKIGKYEIVEVIGEGGMGAVYKAKHPGFGAPRAIKVIKGDFAENPELLRRFYQEAQAVGNLQHPNIVVVHDLGEENGSPFLVMEYVDGVPLDKIIARRESKSLLEKLGIVIEVLNALHYAHQHNIVHRDVKPANVMVLKDGHIKLLDFGIARQGDLGQTKTNQMMGTMWYMSPEQFEGKVVDGRSDVFSAGIMLFELLAYTLPFSNADMSYIMKRMRGDPPPPLSTYLQSYPLELDDIIARALALRDDRYSTAEEFAFELGRVQYRLKRDLAGDRISQARELIQRRDLPRACELLSEAVRLDTENQTAKQLLFELKLTLKTEQRKDQGKQLRAQAEEELAAKQWESAEKLIEEAVKLNATDPESLNLREKIAAAKARDQEIKKRLAWAKVAQQSGELAVAKKAAEDAAALDPQDTNAKLMLTAIGRLIVEQEKQRQVQQFLQSARHEIEARQYSAAQENIANAKAIDAAYPEISGLERMLNAGREQDARQRGLAQLRSQIEQELSTGRARSARDMAAAAMRKFPGDQEFVRLKSAAEGAIEKEERRAYIDERIATATRLVDGGEATRALRMLKDVEREYQADSRLHEYIDVVQQAAERESAAREKQQVLQKARNAMRSKSFAEAISVLESGLVQFPEDAEIKDLLKTARDEFERLSKKKQVEEVGKQAQELLQSRAHTDAIRLLERTSAQVSDPELAKLLEYARNEAARFRAGLQEASEQATQMLNLGQHSEAVTFLEALADKYGKNADFQVLLEQARNQAEGTRRAKARLQTNLKDARAKLRLHDIYGAEALLHLCQREAADDPDVKALAIEIEEEKKAEARRQGEAARLTQEKAAAERRQAEAARLAQEKAAAERREQEAARELEARAAAAASQPPFDSAGATRLDGGSAGASATAMMSSEASAAGVARAGLEEVASLSATQAFGSHAPAVEASVLTPPPIEVAPTPAPAPSKKEEPSKKRKGKAVEASAAIETVIAPAPKKPLESVPLAMPPIVEPKPVAPPRPPKRPEPPPAQPDDVQPHNKRPIFIAGGAVALVLLAVVGWLLVHKSKTSLSTPSVARSYVKLTGLAGASYQIGNQAGYIGDDGTATVEEPPGEYTVVLEKPGYEHFSQPVKVTEGQTTSLEAKMTEIAPPSPPTGTPLGTLVVTSNVDHFDVFVEGRPWPPSSRNGKEVKIDNLPEGSYSVTVKKHGYQDAKEQRVRIIAKKETKPVNFSLEKEPEVITSPTGATTVSTPSPSTNAGSVAPPPITAASTPPPPASVVVPKAVVPKPVINSLNAEPMTVDAGSKIKLVWSVQGADKVLIQPDNVTRAPSDSYEAQPKEPQTTYELIASGPGGDSEPRTVTVKVRPKRDDKAEIVAAKDRWSSAYESMDPAKLHSAFANIPPNLAELIERLRKQNAKINVSYTSCTEPKMTEDSAEMVCTEAVAVIANGQSIPARPRRATLRFSKQGDKWVLNGLSSN
jgi:eukaryotic-like serine/threonine-protein kinase